MSNISELRGLNSGRVAPIGDNARQFLLEPGPNFKPLPEHLGHFPFLIWVVPIKWKNYSCTLHSVVFEITRESCEEIMHVFNLPHPGGIPCVCDCKGRFIE